MPLSIRLPVAFAVLTLLTVPAASAPADDVRACANPNGAPEAAIAACTRLLRAKLSAQERNAVLSYRAGAHQKKGDLEAALRDADDMIRGAPASSLAFATRTQVWLAKSEMQRARQDIEEAIRLSPKDPILYNTRGLIAMIAGQWDEAIADFDRAVRLNPKETGFLKNRSTAWLAKNDYPRALADINEAGRQRTDEVILTSRGDIYRTMGDYDRALADLDAATKLNPKLAGPFVARGLLWRARADFDRAIIEFSEALARDSRYVAGIVGRGLAYESKGDIESAKKDFKTALELPATGQMKGTPAGTFYGSNPRYQATATARLKVLESQTATVPVQTTTTPPAAIKERRIALVIGNGAYTGAGKLANPANDAATIARALRAIGFEVSEGLDLDAKKMKDTINSFLRGASTASMAVMFYAGHGMQIDGKNYLVPVDARLDSGEAMIASVSDVDTILSGLDDQLRTNIVILDACRDNPTVPQTQTTVASRSVQVRSGLAAQSGLGAGATIGAGTLVAFATAPGQVALDGDGTNSPFSAALARHISTPGLEVQQMLTRVRAEVVAATKNKQVPWSNSSLLGEVFLVSSR